MFFGLWFITVPVVVSIAASLFVLLPNIHIWQLEGYKTKQYITRQNREKQLDAQNIRRPFLVYIGIADFAFLSFLILAGFLYYNPVYLYILAIMLPPLAAVMPIYISYLKKPKKKPLVYTARIKRYMIVLFIVLVLAGMILTLVSMLIIEAASPLPLPGIVLSGAAPVLLVTAYYIFAILRPQYIIGLAAFAAQPMERAITQWYYNDGKKKLAAYKDMIKIGITGSYGKTSSKVILGTILSEQYRVIITPHSYNTPMGVTRVIREHMKGDEQVFVAEMGARNIGDIAEMCDLVAPKYGLLTSVGPQHLETFKTIENVANTKYELIEALPEDGIAFFPDDQGICKELYDRTDIEKYLYSIDSGYMSARDITLDERGSNFTLVCADGESAACTTRLLGRHNIQNILGCAAVARRLGLSMRQIAAGIAKVEPVEHRLQLMDTNNGVTVIDDAFNSNPAGARAALDVLKEFKGRKIIITPGLVELGDSEFAENRLFGKEMAGAVDVAVLVAVNGEAMALGLSEAGYDEENIIRTGSLSEATAALSRILCPGDVVLFENDLPDHYEK